MSGLPVFRKFIVENIDGENVMIVGICTQHAQLAGNNDSNVIGGGLWHVTSGSKVITLYGTSDKFGSVPEEIIKECIENGSVYNSRYMATNMTKHFEFKHTTEYLGSAEIKY